MKSFPLAGRFRAVKTAFNIAGEDSYFPELPRKKMSVRFFDNLQWLVRNHEINELYNIYGFDIQNFRKTEEYESEYAFFIALWKLNRVHSPDSQTCLLRDKLLFYKYLTYHGVPTPEVFSVYEDGKLYDTAMHEISIESLTGMTDYFVKDIEGECASFVKHINDYIEFKQLQPLLIHGKYILQKRVYQHPKMAAVNPASLNTLRLITAFDGKNASIFGQFQRFGTSQTGSVDNWAVGGVACQVSSDGVLGKYGFFKPGHGGKIERHETSGIAFEGFEIPYYQEAVSVCLQAHKLFYGVKTIGWDIAITPEGPVLIEGNDNWEIMPVQCVSGGLRAQWHALVACG